MSDRIAINLIWSCSSCGPLPWFAGVVNYNNQFLIDFAEFHLLAARCRGQVKIKEHAYGEVCEVKK